MGLLSLNDLSGAKRTIYPPGFLALQQQAAAAAARDYALRRPVYAMDVVANYPARQFVKIDKGKLTTCLRNCVDSQGNLSGLGQGSECGDAPALGPGELKICCPDLGWVIYDQYESPYAICERASAQASGDSTDAATASDYAAQAEARRRAAEAELEAKREAIYQKRLALEDRQFQQQVQVALLKAQLQKAAAARAATPEAIAARRAAAAEAAARAKAAEEERKKEQTKKAVAYGALALAAVKVLGLF